MKVTVKSINQVHAKNDDGEVRTHDVEVTDAHGVGTGEHKNEPIVERVDVELVDAEGKHVALLHLGPAEKHDLEEGEEYDSVLGHTYEHPAAAPAEPAA